MLYGMHHPQRLCQIRRPVCFEFGYVREAALSDLSEKLSRYFEGCW
jgi:hypothetical protein